MLHDDRQRLPCVGGSRIGHSDRSVHGQYFCGAHNARSCCGGQPSSLRLEVLRALPEERVSPAPAKPVACEPTECEPVDCNPISCESGFFEDAGEKEVLYSTNAVSLFVGAGLSGLASLLRCFRASQEVVALANHGRGAELQNHRTRGRGRMSIAPAGALGTALV